MSSIKMVRTKPISECDLQAVEWYERVQDADAATLAAFDDWLSVSAEHRQAYLEAELLHEALGELADNANAHGLLDQAPDQHGETRQRIDSGTENAAVVGFLPENRARFYGVVGVALAACLAVFSVVNLDWFAEPDTSTTIVASTEQSFSTGPGEVLRKQLVDGTQLVIGPGSIVEVTFNQDQRRVMLSVGEAYFDVSKDSNRPFYVETTDTSIKVVGTQFDVKTRSKGASIGVVEGVVHVFNGRETARNFGSSSLPTTLLAGQFARSDGAQAIVVENSLASSDLAAWRNGRLVYRGSQLQDVVLDANRYLTQQVILLNDDTLGGEKITLSVDVANLDELPLMISELLDLDVATSNTETVLSRK